MAVKALLGSSGGAVPRAHVRGQFSPRTQQPSSADRLTTSSFYKLQRHLDRLRRRHRDTMPVKSVNELAHPTRQMTLHSTCEQTAVRP